MPGISIRSPTVACVVSVTWALARFGLLAVRLLADFVVTEAMVGGRGPAVASRFTEGGAAAARSAGLAAYAPSQAGGQALAGQPRGGRRALAGDASSRGGPDEFGRWHSAARRVCQAC